MSKKSVKQIESIIKKMEENRDAIRKTIEGGFMGVGFTKRGKATKGGGFLGTNADTIGQNFSTSGFYAKSTKMGEGFSGKCPQCNYKKCRCIDEYEDEPEMTVQKRGRGRPRKNAGEITGGMHCGGKCRCGGDFGIGNDPLAFDINKGSPFGGDRTGGARTGGMKKVNPWMKFLADFRKKHPELKHDPVKVTQMASKAYRK